MPVCYHCKQSFDGAGTIGRTDTCPVCDADLHCCLNCRHYAPGAYNECRESQAERVLDKERANFCDFFSVRDTGSNSITSAPRKANPLDALFTKPGHVETKAHDRTNR